MNFLFSLVISVWYMQSVLPDFPVSRYILAEETGIKVPKAKRVVESSHTIAGDTLVLSSRKMQEFQFSNAGRLQKVYDYVTSGTRKLVYEFDEHGRIVYHQREGQLFVYRYEDAARTSNEYYYDKDSVLIEKTIAYYSSKNKLTKKEIYRSDAKLSRYWLFDYNSHGDLIRERFINTADGVRMGSRANAPLLPNDSTLYRYTYGDTITTGRLGSEGSVKELTKEFKVKDTLVTQRFLESTKLKRLVMVSEMKSIKHLKIERRKVYTWHAYAIKDDLLQRYHNFDDTKTIQLDVYKYVQQKDANGNWTSRITEINGKKKKQSVRVIDYY